MVYLISKLSFYLIQHVAGSYKSWELHRLEEKLWDYPAAILHHPRQSGGLSHTFPSICGRKKTAISQDMFSVNLTVSSCFLSKTWVNLLKKKKMQVNFPYECRRLTVHAMNFYCYTKHNAGTHQAEVNN